jgi:hypothetical protein
MQSLKKIMQEMGFNKDAPIETQKAFLKHLIAAANQTHTQTEAKTTQPAPKLEPIKTHQPQEQLELDLGIINENSLNKKRVS